MTHQNLRHGMCWKLILTIHVISSSSSSLSSPMNFIEVTKKISLLTHKKTQPSSQPHAGFFESNYAILAQFLAHAQTFDRGVSITKPRTHAINRVSLVVTYHGCKFIIPKIVLQSVQSTRCVENYSQLL